ncbi:MAG TPA: phosphoribosyltransferase family protein [Gaiellaceae bacterium]|jgi:putative phosphoribosyl transferase
MSERLFLGVTPLFADRRDAGRALAAALAGEREPELVVVGLARGGLEVAAEVARILPAPLDVLAVRKVGHPDQPEYGLGAVTPGDGLYLRGPNGLTAEQVATAVDKARTAARQLDRRLHREHAPLDLAGNTVLVVDDGLATGGSMIAALRWASAADARRVVAAVPVGPTDTVELLRAEADEVVCLYPLSDLFAVGVWYRSFEQVADREVVRLLDENRRARPREAVGRTRAQSLQPIVRSSSRRADTSSSLSTPRGDPPSPRRESPVPAASRRPPPRPGSRSRSRHGTPREPPSPG